MKRFFYRVVLVATASMVLLPRAGAQQPQDRDSGRAQSDNPSQQRQSRAGALQRQRQHMAALAEKLNLTDAQKKQFQEISRKMISQGIAIRRDTSLTEAQKKGKMQELRRQMHKEMFAVLTQEQKDQLKQMREQHQKEQEKKDGSGDQASTKKKAGGSAGDDDDPFAGMTSDDDDEPGS